MAEQRSAARAMTMGWMDSRTPLRTMYRKLSNTKQHFFICTATCSPCVHQLVWGYKRTHHCQMFSLEPYLSVHCDFQHSRCMNLTLWLSRWLIFSYQLIITITNDKQLSTNNLSTGLRKTKIRLENCSMCHLRLLVTSSKLEHNNGSGETYGMKSKCLLSAKCIFIRQPE